MSLMENRTPNASCEVKECDEAESSGDEGPYNNYFKKSNAKIDPVESAYKILNGYCKAQGVTDNDVIYWDGQVREMMESVKKIRDRLPAISKLDNVFNFSENELKNGKIPRTENDLKTSIAEIDKMDVVLKLKATEERKAKLSRIQLEEESRDILKNLPSFDQSNRFKLNFQDFMRLLNDVENTETGSVPLQLKKDQEEGTIEDGEKVEKLEQKKSENFKFVERNIRLAKCGRGTLSLTDEEKSRLDNLLKNVESNSKPAKELKMIEEVAEEPFYGIDNETKEILGQIDRKLEALRRKKGRPKWNLSFLEKNVKDDKQNPIDRKTREKSPNRLDKINKMLSIMNSVTKEEISPLTEKEISDLVQQSDHNETEENTKPEDCPESKPPQNVIADLVSDAQMLMPKFKYRFDNS